MNLHLVVDNTRPASLALDDAAKARLEADWIRAQTGPRVLAWRARREGSGGGRPGESHCLQVATTPLGDATGQALEARPGVEDWPSVSPSRRSLDVSDISDLNLTAATVVAGGLAALWGWCFFSLVQGLQ